MKDSFLKTICTYLLLFLRIYLTICSKKKNFYSSPMRGRKVMFQIKKSFLDDTHECLFRKKIENYCKDGFVNIFSNKY